MANDVPHANQRFMEQFDGLARGCAVNIGCYQPIGASGRGSQCKPRRTVRGSIGRQPNPVSRLSRVSSRRLPFASIFLFRLERVEGPIALDLPNSQTAEAARATSRIRDRASDELLSGTEPGYRNSRQ